MPIYEYCCDACEHRFEAIQKVTEPVLKSCPVCNKTTLKKLVSAPQFKLKGTGWYETDFKNKKKEPANGKKEDKKDNTDSKVKTKENAQEKKVPNKKEKEK